MRARLCGVLVIAACSASACKPESSRKAAVAADEAAEQRNDLVEAAKKVPDHPNIVAGARQVLVEAGELAEAGQKFRRAKYHRLAVLRSNHDVIATHGGLVGAMSRELPITDAARGDINEKLTRFQMRLDEAANMIEGLEKVDIDTWEARDADMVETMELLEEARQSAWRALADAPQSKHGAS